MARRPNDGIAEASLADLEDGVIPLKCFSCGSKQQQMMKVHFKEGGVVVRTKCKIGVCTNPKCFRYLDPRKVESWVRDDEIIPNAQQLGATRSGELTYDPRFS